MQAYGLSYYNTSSSDEMVVNKSSKLKGYYYAINKDSKYSVSEKDSFTDKCDVDYIDEYGTYYFHIASVDEAGNISETKTYKFETKDITLDDKKENSNDESSNSTKPPANTNQSQDSDRNDDVDETNSIIRSLIRKVGNISETNLENAIEIINKIPENVIKEMNNNNISIYLTSGEAEDVCKTLTGATYESITGIFIWGDSKPAVICETAYMDSTLLHELGHATDYILGNENLISDNDEFAVVYEEEKDVFFANNSHIRDSQNEYFAETFAMYYNNNYQLKTKAPKTYEFLKKNLK